MPFVQQRYGKANVRVLRLHRQGDYHEVREVRVKVTLDGEFTRAYTQADNAPVVTTDSMKNLVQVLALEHLARANEPFSLAIAQCFLDRYAHVAKALVEIDETSWSRMQVDGQPHDHSFVKAEGGTPFAAVTVTRSSQDIVAGIRDFQIMKTTQSGFVGYVRDEYTTLPETTDRILATRLQAAWRFKSAQPTDYAAVTKAIRAALLQVFATTYSDSVQDSVYRMGEAALVAAPDIAEITLSMPNIHYLPISLSHFGLETQDQLFLPTDEPNGHIEATMRRG
ncbi:factor-independent urate hydroxylase [Candidatus Entotheonella palauensis]|uniref:factor-independent urate hydroxylase n=1 Tax=Candidatus Entotheonella palauensis TaxID=93172 RepID=UPI000B7F1084|nr:urate oxidase [Candidatus Entotheonella palauensis]